MSQKHDEDAFSCIHTRSNSIATVLFKLIFQLNLMGLISINTIMVWK